MSSLLSYVFASPFCRISCHFISCFLRMQSRNTAELRDVFSSLLRVFDMAAACAGILFFCARQKRLRQVPVPERCAAAALLFFLILQILSFSPFFPFSLLSHISKSACYKKRFIFFEKKSIIYFVRIVKCPTFAPALQEKQG